MFLLSKHTIGGSNVDHKEERGLHLFERVGVVHKHLLMNDIHRGNGDKNQEEKVFFHTEGDFSTDLMQLSTGWPRKE